jgi:hypothetical protein
MNAKNVLALCGVTAATVGLLTGVAFAASGPAVTVRVEGLKKTLLAPTVVHVHSGSITKGGAPSGACPAKSAAGALDAATRHKWGGTWSTSFSDYEITSILGESHAFTSKYYWEIVVNNVSASAGACALKLHTGEQLMFAAVPDTGTEFPIAIEAPSSATVGHQFDATVVWFNAKGKSKPLAGATVSIAGHVFKTDSHGIVPLTPDNAGTFTLNATDTGYIRAAPVMVHVSS